MTEDHAEWSFATARQAATFTAAQEPGHPHTDHAIGSDGTLCGIPRDRVVLYRHLFSVGGSVAACPRCRELAAAAPTVPCGQERLHDLVLAAEPGRLRTELLEALRSGANISIWINGSNRAMAFYACLEHITDGAETVREVLSTGTSEQERIGVARVTVPSGEFIVLLPQRADPIIAFAAS